MMFLITDLRCKFLNFGGITFKPLPIKFRILPFILLLTILACSKDEDPLVSPPDTLDMPFLVGLKDTHDLHAQYLNPIEIPNYTGIGIDFEQDGEADFFLSKSSYFGNLTGESSIEYYTEYFQTNPWQIAAVPFQDSIFFCRDSTSTSPQLSNYYYNQAVKSCNGTHNEFIAYRHLGEQPTVLSKGSGFSQISSWLDKAVIHHYEFNQSPTHFEEYRLPLYNDLSEEHYLSLRKITGSDTLYAWVKIQVEAQEFPWKVKILEWAVQKEGTR